MIHVKRATFVEKLPHKSIIKFVMVQLPNCQKSEDCATRNNCQTQIDAVIHFVHNLMVDQAMTATLMEGSDCPRG